MRTTSIKIAEQYLEDPVHFRKEHDRLPTNKTRDGWDDTVTDPVKGILFGILMGGLLWAAILLLVIFW